MMLTPAQMQELNEVRAEVRAVTGASSLKAAEALTQEVNQMMWAVDSASYIIREAQGVGRVLETIRTKVAEIRGLQEAEKQLRSAS